MLQKHIGRAMRMSIQCESKPLPSRHTFLSGRIACSQQYYIAPRAIFCLIAQKVPSPISAILLPKASRMNTFFTLGHSNHPIESWIALARQHHIEVVVDTRSSPYSKYVPQFDREPLQRSLEEAGFRYLFLGAELGGRPSNPAYYDASGHVLYSRLREDARFLIAINRLESGIERFRVALLCGEEDPAHCHRRLLIGRVLSERGHTMIHIRGDGRLESDDTVALDSGKPLVDSQPALFAELDEDKWRSTASVLHKKVPASSSAH